MPETTSNPISKPKMSKRTFFKTVRRAVSKSLGRFIAIIAIVALGVGFLTGLLSATPDMKKTVDAYYDEFNAADLELRATTPFTTDELTAIREAAGVSGVRPVLSIDTPVVWGDENPVARIYMYDFASSDADNINRLELISGTIPSAGECLVERGGQYFADIGVGQKLSYSGVTMTVSGVVGNTWYFSNQREPSNAGNGRVGTVIYVNAAPPIVTNVFVSVTGARKMDAFGGKYLDTVNAAAESIRAAMPKRTEGLYVLDRSSNVGFKSFEMAAGKVAAVAVVFPAFFFLVAALVALTTMTRMVEDERGQIGALKSLGYGKGTIMLKYLIYALIAGAIGCAVGVLVGFELLPAVIWNAYKFMFHLPQLTIHFNVLYAGLSSLAALAAIVLATVWACLRTLREKPAQLLQPRAPKPGGKILLERMPFLWNRMKFKYKSTARNLFRYKKHFFMTVIGVGGCTALMLTGFGLGNSTDAIANKQYEQILRYDMTINVAGQIDDGLEDFLTDNSVITDWAGFYGESGYLSTAKGREAVSLLMPETPEDLNRFVRLGTDKREIAFTDTSVVLTQKIAEVLGLRAGDRFTYETSSGKKTELTLVGITENYVGSTLYVGGSTMGAFGGVNTVLATSPVPEAQFDDTLSRLLALPNVTGAQFTAQEKATYDDLVTSIGFVVAILVVSAGALAVIVLYNLININIIERSKELATLKVLGYRPAEIAGYILREIIIMTVVGILVGLAIGVGLHYFVVCVADTLDLMFGRGIAWWSYLAAAGVTLAFSLLVDLVMCIKLRRINMIDSMKASE